VIVYRFISGCATGNRSIELVLNPYLWAGGRSW